jgi:hypothetical protein
MEDSIKRFCDLFAGYEKAHGQHELFGEADENGKIKGKAKTLGYGASMAEYKAHLSGAGPSLGVIPLLENNRCSWGAIDIDIQGEVVLREQLDVLESRIRKMELPLVVCRSKSGGAHLYLFCDPPVAAQILQKKLGEFAAALGYGGTEVFPKQITRVNENDRGNWINICYYGVTGVEPTNRFCIRNGKPIMELAEFVKYAEMMRITERALVGVAIAMGSDFADGPPCLQHLATHGLDQGGRNISLTNVAIYYKKKNPDSWQDDVMKFNFDKVSPSLDHAEVSQILKNISRKEYFYTCKNPPLCNHCDKKACAKREFGITFGSSAGELFPIENLTRCSSKDSVRWYAEHQGCRLELTTDQLFNPFQLQKVFAEKFMVVIISGKHKDWLVRLKELMLTCDEVTDPEDASKQGQFEKLLDNFFSASRPARNRDELIKGNSYTENGRIYFRSEDLFNYLNVRRFNHNTHEIWQWLKDVGATDHQMRIKGKMLRTWSLPEPEKFDNMELTTAGVESEL